MIVNRKINPESGVVELWWANDGLGQKPVFVSKISDEQPLVIAAQSGVGERGALCWTRGRTLGNINVRSPDLLRHFPGSSAMGVNLPCDFVYAGKYRHGAERWWCRTHQRHWGTKADLAALLASNEMRCTSHAQLMNYETEPYLVALDARAEVGIWCSLPAAISTAEVKARPPKIHVHMRDIPGGPKRIDKDFAAICAVYSTNYGLLEDTHNIQVDITPPAAFDFVLALEANKDMDCINCSHCGHPHLDLGDFSKSPHRKHLCANCGRDSTWSKRPIISTPLQPLHEHNTTHQSCLLPYRSLNLDEYQGHSYTIWASTPAIVWTANRPQEYGIHVHVHKGANRIIDDTFGEVILNGKALVREKLLQVMVDRTVV